MQQPIRISLTAGTKIQVLTHFVEIKAELGVVRGFRFALNFQSWSKDKV